MCVCERERERGGGGGGREGGSERERERGYLHVVTSVQYLNETSKANVARQTSVYENQSNE